MGELSFHSREDAEAYADENNIDTEWSDDFSDTDPATGQSRTRKVTHSNIEAVGTSWVIRDDGKTHLPIDPNERTAVPVGRFGDEPDPNATGNPLTSDPDRDRFGRRDVDGDGVADRDRVSDFGRTDRTLPADTLNDDANRRTLDPNALRSNPRPSDPNP